ncbi:MAG: GNAT family N-acetyltransferase [Pseudomonadota bacterium]
MIKLRLIIEEDRELLFGWRNLPEIIENSLSQKGVSWEEHDHWFSKCLSEMFFSCLPFIIVYKRKLIGHIRFEKRNDALCEVHIYLLGKYRDRKLGSEALEQGIEEVKKVWPGIVRIKACVQEDSYEGANFFMEHNFLAENAEYEKCWVFFRLLNR